METSTVHHRCLEQHSTAVLLIFFNYNLKFFHKPGMQVAVLRFLYGSSFLKCHQLCLNNVVVFVELLQYTVLSFHWTNTIVTDWIAEWIGKDPVSSSQRKCLMLWRALYIHFKHIKLKHSKMFKSKIWHPELMSQSLCKIWIYIVESGREREVYFPKLSRENTN